MGYSTSARPRVCRTQQQCAALCRSPNSAHKLRYPSDHRSCESLSIFTELDELDLLHFSWRFLIVQVKTSFTSMYHFVTQLCAIVGGVFTVAGMVAASVETGLASIKQKESIGKLGWLPSHQLIVFLNSKRFQCAIIWFSWCGNEKEGPSNRTRQ